MEVSNNKDDDVRQRVLRVLEQFLARRDTVVDPKGLSNMQALGIDSLGITELVFEIAEEFGIDDRAIADDTLRNLRTVDDLVEAVRLARNSQ